MRPTVTRETGVIRITHGHERLRVETVFRRRAKGWKRASSTLYQDGERRPTVSSWEAYAELFQELAGEQPARLEPEEVATLKPAELQSPHLVPEDSKVPIQVRQQTEGLRRALSAKEPAPVITLGLDDRGRYVIEVKSPKATMQVFFDTGRRSGARFATLALDDPIRLVTADGTDHTKEIDGKLEEALSRLAQADHPEVEEAEGTKGASQSARAGGPQSRKGTVLRL
ncbi:hypothetical protein [Streptomyces sp. WM6378]|uniref:hypothetical protein n=1 Tax=Streptomyces sp. WM6378 TaxID=1415557 RepID=UPI00131D6BFB|nr:hypothetical protein [Streptomyces sp. WM6378]